MLKKKIRVQGVDLMVRPDRARFAKKSAKIGESAAILDLVTFAEPAGKTRRQLADLVAGNADAIKNTIVGEKPQKAPESTTSPKVDRDDSEKEERPSRGKRAPLGAKKRPKE